MNEENVKQEPEKDMKTVIEDLSKEMKALRTEVFVNRIVMAICLIIALAYAHFQVSHFSNVLGTLFEMLMS